MPVGSVGKWLVLGTLAATLGAGGCKEDPEDPPPADAGNTPTDAGNTPTDSGATDSGARDSGSTDAGTDAGAPVICGGATCTSHQVNPVLPAFPAGCAKDHLDAEVCGISTASTLPQDAGFPAFLPKDAPGVASSTCGAFLESKIEMPVDGGTGDSGAMNGFLDSKRTLMIGGMNIEVGLAYPGCCTPLGFCSGNTKEGTSYSALAPMGSPSNGGFGCMDSKYFLQAAPAALQQVPCDPATGVIKATDGGAGEGGTDGGTDSGASDAGADGGNG
jgi:hypothetical protein